MLVISFAEMGRAKGDELPRPAPKYIALLQRLVEEHGVKPRDVGRTKMTYSRFFGDAKEKTQTLAMANRFAEAVRKKGGNVPPSWVQVLDKEDYEWITLGRELRESREDHFVTMLNVLRTLAPSSREVVQAIAKLEELAAKK